MRYLLYSILLFVTIGAVAQTDNIGSGRAIQFDGVDDYIDFGDIYDNVHFPISVSVWLMIDPAASGGMPVFDSQSNLQVYSGFYVSVSQTAVAIGYGDGTGEFDPIYRRGKQQSVTNISGRWINITTVVRGATDMDIYFNGVNIGGSYVGSSDLPMGASSLEVAKAGFRDTNNSPIHFQGLMDELRVFNVSLTQDQVRENMCKKLIGNEAGLIGYWNFDETTEATVYDKSTSGFNGELKNNPTRVFSGAPIGDDSKYMYSGAWSGTTFSMQDGDDLKTANNIQGNPEGIHIYEVKSPPSQTGGLGASATAQPYFGIFVAALDQDNSFDATYTYQGSTSCKIFSRVDNSFSSWTNSTNPLIHISNREEIVKSALGSVVFDLGPDKILCNQASTIISTGITDPQFSFSWNTGENTSSINVAQSGKYLAKVSGLCGTVKDSILITFENFPPPVSLGDDQELCSFKPVTLNALNSADGYQIQWQDKSSGTTFQVNKFGKYWVSVKNDCGTTSDTITFSRLKLQVNPLPNVITPDNGDSLNQYFKIQDNLKGNVTLLVLNRWGKEVYKSDHYQNDWDGGGLSPGVYYVVLTGQCIDEVRETLTILH